MTGPVHPNILLVQADQMASFATPFAGNGFVKAPVMSRIARDGVVFDNAYCNFPLCAPSRFSMLSGQLASRIGAFDNGAEFPAATPTIAHYLRALGYYTGLIGKMHFIGPDQLHGYEERLTTDIYPADFSWTADWKRDASASTAEMRVVTQAGPCRRSIQIDFDDEVAFRANRALFDIARRKRTSPFFLTVSLTHPHDPFLISEEFWNLYDHDAVAGPRLPAARDPHSHRINRHFGIDEAGITDAQIRNARHAYYGSISYVDAKLGELLRTLETCNLLDETIVIVTSDHGEFLGERGLWFKRSFFEESARVPLAFYAPKLFRAGRVARNVSLVDLLPTLYELAGDRPLADPADALDGASFAGLLKGDDPRGSAKVFGEVLCECVSSPLLMVKSDNLKYVACETDPPLLFDLDKDPDEQTNFAGHPAYAAAERALAAEVAGRWDVPRLKSEIVSSQKRRKFVVDALNRGGVTPWDYQPPATAHQEYYRGNLAFDVDALVRTALELGILRQDGRAILHDGNAIGAGLGDVAGYLRSHVDTANAVVRQIHEARGFLW